MRRFKNLLRLIKKMGLEAKDADKKAIEKYLEQQDKVSKEDEKEFVLRHSKTKF